jgi:CDGSH-type Zn-finger protein
VSVTGPRRICAVLSTLSGRVALLGLSGPLWVRGGIPVESGHDGRVYESRSRVTLCRCGRSQNKPFCDGTHAAIGFRDDWCSAQP